MLYKTLNNFYYLYKNAYNTVRINTPTKFIFKISVYF
jgi:hypothetical protein